MKREICCLDVMDSHVVIPTTDSNAVKQVTSLLALSKSVDIFGQCAHVVYYL